MKFLADFFPIILFFVVYYWGIPGAELTPLGAAKGIYAATMVAIIAAAVQVAWQYFRHGKAERMHLITLGILVLFGGLTLALHDPTFIMWKPTIVNWLFGAGFLGSAFFGAKTLIERLMGHAIEVPKPIWTRLNLAWTLFFFASGVINLLVVYVFSGFYQAKQALVLASGEPEVDLASCAEQFQGEVLALCESAHGAEQIWVNFKLFGMMGLTLAFVIAQAFYLARHVQDDQDENPQATETN